MADGSRKFHTKSRNACGQCKRRHVKCNLQAPVCYNCWKRDELCDYQSLSLASSSSSCSLPNGGPDEPQLAHGDVSAFQLARNQASQAAWPQFFDISSSASMSIWPINEDFALYRRQLQLRGPAFGSALNMELMRNFIERTSLAVDLVADGDPLWQREAVQASACFPFLQHALMALSGLHICHEIPPASYSQSYYYKAACWHSVRASELFRASVYNVDEGNWQPVLIFLIASIIFSLDVLLLDQAMDKALSKHPPISPASFLLILRHPGSLSKQLISRLVSGSLAVTLLQRQNKLRSPADEQVIDAINSLDHFCTAKMSYDPDAKTYNDAIKSLKRWAKLVSCRPQSWHGLVGWPVMVSEQYIQLLRDGDEFAAVVFCYWCAVMDRAPKRYYLVGVMKKLEVTATAGINAEWDTLLEWPRKELQSM